MQIRLIRLISLINSKGPCQLFSHHPPFLKGCLGEQPCTASAWRQCFHLAAMRAWRACGTAWHPLLVLCLPGPIYRREGAGGSRRVREWGHPIVILTNLLDNLLDNLLGLLFFSRIREREVYAIFFRAGSRPFPEFSDPESRSRIQI